MSLDSINDRGTRVCPRRREWAARLSLSKQVIHLLVGISQGVQGLSVLFRENGESRDKVPESCLASDPGESVGLSLVHNRRDVLLVSDSVPEGNADRLVIRWHSFCARDPDS